MARQAIDSVADYMADPSEVAQQGQQDIMKGLESNNFTAKGAAFGQILGRSLNGGMDPATQKAAAEQNAVKETMANLAPKGDNESDLDYQLRQNNAMYNTVAPHNPQLAMRIADHMATLSEARSQQKSLEARTAETEQESQIKAITQGTIVWADAKGNKLGQVERFIPGTNKPNPDFQDQYGKLQAEFPDGTPTTAEKFELDKRALASQKADYANALELLKEKAKLDAGNVDDETLKGYIADKATYGHAALNRLDQAHRDAITRYQRALGINDSDLVTAQNQVATLRSEGVAAGRRVGNIDVLSHTLKPLGDALLEAATHVDRGRYQFVNDMERMGRLQLNDPNEQRLAHALNAFNTEYARAMSGGVGHTSDSSRADTAGLLPAGADLARIKAGVDQVVNKEQVALQKGGDEALEATAHPEKYSALLKVEAALRGNEEGGKSRVFSSTVSGNTAAAPAGPAAVPVPPPPAGSGAWGPVKIVSG